MLEDFISRAASERLRSGLFGAHIEAHCSRLRELGYRATSIKHKLWTVSVLARWMTKKRLALADLDERCVESFRDARKKRGHTCRGLRRTALMLLEQIRADGAIRTPEVVRDESPFSTVLAPYTVFLSQERAVTAGTIAEYQRIARAFLSESLHEPAERLDALNAGGVRDFLLARVQRLAPKRLQLVGSGLRSFLRFLFVRGETKTDLALAVVTVRQRRLSGVPRHMSPEDVETLLRSCDRSSATGRRNHALLLLLARLGLRASEVVALELADLRWREGEIVIRGKGLVRDRLPLLPDVGRALALYLKKDRPVCASRRVFLRARAPHRGLGHASTVSTIVMRALAQAGLAPGHRGAHLLRHSLATAMVRRGASFAEIGQVLRHRSPNTTEIYAKLDFGALRDIALPWPMTRGAQ